MRISMSRHCGAAFIALCIFITGLLLPWHRQVRAPAILKPALSTEIFTPAKGQVYSVHVRNQSHVVKGQTLFVLKSQPVAENPNAFFFNRASTPSLEDRSSLMVSSTKARFKKMKAMIANQPAHRTMLRDRSMSNLIYVRAPHDGIIHELSPQLQKGQNMDQKFRLARITDPNQLEVISYIPYADRARLNPRASLVFRADYGGSPTPLHLQKIEGRVANIEQGTQTFLQDLSLSEPFGGSIKVRLNAKGQSMPIAALVRVSGDVNFKRPSAVVSNMVSNTTTRDGVKMASNQYGKISMSDAMVQQKNAGANLFLRPVKGVAHIQAHGISPLQKMWRFAITQKAQTE